MWVVVFCLKEHRLPLEFPSCYAWFSRGTATVELQRKHVPAFKLCTGSVLDVSTNGSMPSLLHTVSPSNTLASGTTALLFDCVSCCSVRYHDVSCVATHLKLSRALGQGDIEDKKSTVEGSAFDNSPRTRDRHDTACTCEMDTWSNQNSEPRNNTNSRTKNHRSRNTTQDRTSTMCLASGPEYFFCEVHLFFFLLRVTCPKRFHFVSVRMFRELARVAPKGLLVMFFSPNFDSASSCLHHVVIPGAPQRMVLAFDG